MRDYIRDTILEENNWNINDLCETIVEKDKAIDELKDEVAKLEGEVATLEKANNES